MMLFKNRRLVAEIGKQRDAALKSMLLAVKASRVVADDADASEGQLRTTLRDAADLLERAGKLTYELLDWQIAQSRRLHFLGAAVAVAWVILIALWARQLFG